MCLLSVSVRTLIILVGFLKRINCVIADLLQVGQATSQDVDSLNIFDCLYA